MGDTDLFGTRKSWFW